MLISALRTIDATWETRYTQDLWDALLEQKTDSGNPGGIEFLTLGPVLPDEVDPRVAMVHVHRHHDDKEGAVTSPPLHWNLIVSSPPNSAPPDVVKEMNQKLGGRDGLMKLLENCMIGIPPIASFRLVADIRRTEYQCKHFPRVVVAPGEHEIAASLAPSCRLEQIGYRFENSDYGLEEVAIVYDHEDDSYVMKSRARRMLRLSLGTLRTWLPYAEEVTELLITAFFEKRLAK